MTTNCVAADDAAIRMAAEILRKGGLVAFPTETVYGLGADATNPAAISEVYRVKGRPSDNPLIWHGNDIAEFENFAVFSDDARRMAEMFWPGPFTMVVQRKGGGTLALRVPFHPVARALIAAAGCLVAAPSANLSGRPSPTLARHVMEDLEGAIDMIIDGGPTQKGLESTVVDMHGEKPRLLRPGAVTMEMLRDVINIDVATGETGDSPLSPGMKYRHYSPKAPLILLIGPPEAVSAKIESYDKNAGIMRTSQESAEYTAQTLFERLRTFDEMRVPLILAEGRSEEGVGLAVMNRLKKAAAEVIYL